MKKSYIIYDSRAVLLGTDETTVFEVCDTLKEAIKTAPDYGDSCCIYSYDEKLNPDNSVELINQKFERQL